MEQRKSAKVGPSEWTSPLESASLIDRRLGAGRCRQGCRRGCRRRSGGARALDRRLGASRQGRVARKPPKATTSRCASLSAGGSPACRPPPPPTRRRSRRARRRDGAGVARRSVPGPGRRSTVWRARSATSTCSIRPRFPPTGCARTRWRWKTQRSLFRASPIPAAAAPSAGLGGLVLATSHGFLGQYIGSRFSRSASVIAGEGTGMERDYDFSSRLHFADLDAPEAIGRSAGERAVRRLNPRKAKTGEVDRHLRSARGARHCRPSGRRHQRRFRRPQDELPARHDGQAGRARPPSPSPTSRARARARPRGRSMARASRAER